MKIIVTGSLGNISKPLTSALLQKGHEVTVISSSIQKRLPIEQIGAHAEIGSVTDAGFLSSVFKGADVIYTMVPPNFSAPDPVAYYKQVGNSYIDGLQHSGVSRVVHLSSWGAHLPKGTGIIVGSHEVEKILNSLIGINISFLRPTSFYNNLYNFIGMIKSAGFIGTNYGGDDKLVLVSPKDIAEAALEEIESQTPGITIRYVASDEHTCNHIAAALGNVINKPGLQWLTLTEAETLDALLKNGIPEKIASNLVELNASIHSGAIRSDYDLHQPIMGKAKLGDFAKDFAKAFNAYET